MRYRINQVKIDPNSVAAKGGGISSTRLIKELEREVKDRNGDKSLEISGIEIIRESIDARKKPDVKLVYTLDFDCERELELGEAPEAKKIPKVIEVKSKTDDSKTTSLISRPVVVGFGPCGIFAALTLAEAGFKPIVIERGKPVDERIADVESFWKRGESPDPQSNVQFGEGGAGTFSDGKLTTGKKDPRIRRILETFVEAGADPSILYKQKPHIGTDKLRELVLNLRQRIEALGGDIRFNSRLEGIETADLIKATIASSPSSGSYDSAKEQIETEFLVLAIGHSARDTFQMLFDYGFDMRQKAFSIGVRIEHPQQMINEVQYGDASLAEIIGPADYKLNYRCKGRDNKLNADRGVYTFCMCPGGQVVNASTEIGTAVTNGMSNSRRDSGLANSGLLVDVRTSDFKSQHPLAGIEFQKKYEKLAWENRKCGGKTGNTKKTGLPTSTYYEFKKDVKNANSKKAGGSKKAYCNPISRSLPEFAVKAITEAMLYLPRKLKGFDRGDAVMTAVESRSSSPVKILRDENMEILQNGRAVHGIIPAGEGPGYAGGIMSAAVDGIKAAEMIIEKMQKR